MSNIILLFLCLAIGILLRKCKRAPDNSNVAINTFIIHVSLPALTLPQLHAVQFQPSLLYAVAMPWILLLMGAAFFWSIAKALTLTPQTTGGLMLCCGLANTSFVGPPMIEAFYGTSGMAIGILIDQLGTYLVLSTLGIAIAALYSTGKPSGQEIIKRMSTFPPFIALLLAIRVVAGRIPPVANRRPAPPRRYLGAARAGVRWIPIAARSSPECQSTTRNRSDVQARNRPTVAGNSVCETSPRHWRRCQDYPL
jgi:malate permease and related proteins